MGLLKELVAEEQIADVVQGIVSAVDASFREDGSRATGDEIRRRFNISIRILEELRGDLGWAMPRVLDHLARCLRCKLDGIPWTPDARALWGSPQSNDPSPERKP